MKKPGLAVLLALGVGLLLLVEFRPWQSLSETSLSPVASPEQKGVVSDAVKVLKGDPTKGSTGSASSPSDALLALESQPIRAQLSPVTFTTISAELSAKVQEIPRREGDYFKQGDTLIVFDCSAQRAQLQKSQAALSITERNFETNKKLIALGAVGQVEHDNSRSEFEKSKAEVEELTSVIGRCRTLAPFPGRVVEQRVRSQQFVQAGQPLLEILDNRALELEFIAPSRWAGWIKPGFRFQIKVDETNKSYPARVTRVGARIDSVSQTIKIAAVIDGAYLELSPGMSGTLSITEPQRN